MATTREMSLMTQLLRGPMGFEGSAVSQVHLGELGRELAEGNWTIVSHEMTRLDEGVLLSVLITREVETPEYAEIIE